MKKRKGSPEEEKKVTWKIILKTEMTLETFYEPDDVYGLDIDDDLEGLNGEEDEIEGQWPVQSPQCHRRCHRK